MMIKHVRWYVNLTKWKPEKAEWLKLTSSVPKDEVERVSKFVFQDDAKASLVGQALIRKFLTQSLRIPSNKIILKRTQHGRPELCYDQLTQYNIPQILDFNVSHSGDFCVLAGICSEVEQSDLPPDSKISIGVDVTKIVKKKTKEELDRFLSLMSRREFTKSEWETVEKGRDDRQKCINFTRLWCLKESYIKAIGLGLSFKLSRIDFIFQPKLKYNLNIDDLLNGFVSNTKVLLDGEAAKDWRFLETALDQEHMIALAYAFQGIPSEIDHDEFLEESSCFIEISVESICESLTPLHEIAELSWLKYSSSPVKPSR